MDYDENDFQNQNFQLAGEDKQCSANLRTFDLPKFDLDEHLRFDSLVETEVLLGVQAQANNWIDFPAVSSAVEFSSSAADSCSISMHKNVWSEATSSESVDLLLKSMGEDEIMTSKAVIMEASANGGPHDIDNPADLHVKKNDAHNSSMIDVLSSDPGIMQDKCQENLSSPNEVLRELLPHLQGQSQDTEEYSSVSGRLPCEYVEGYDVHGIRNQQLKYSTMHCGDRVGKLDLCMHAVDNKQDAESQLAKNRNKDVDNATQLPTELHASFHVNYETQGTEIEDCDRMITNPQSITCEKSGYIVEGNSTEVMDVDRQKMILDADKDESALTETVSYAETKTSPSTYCKSNVYKESKSVPNSPEVHIAHFDVSVDKDFSLPCTDLERTDSGTASYVMENVEYSSAADQQIAEVLPLNNSDKLVHKELDSDGKDVKMSDLTIDLASEKVCDVGSICHPFNMKEASPEKLSQEDSGVKLASLAKSMDSQLSEAFVGSNLAIKQKDPSFSDAPDLFNSEENEVKHSGGSRLTDSKKRGDMEGHIGADTGSNFIEDALINISRKCQANAGVQSPSAVQSIDCTPCQNEVLSSTGDAVGNGKSLLLEGNKISRGYSVEGKDGVLNAIEVFSHVRNEASIASDVLNSHTNGSSQICTGSSVHSNLSEAESGNPNSSEHNCSSPRVISCRECSRDNSEHQELKVLQLENDEITHMFECNSKDLRQHGSSAEDRSINLEVSTIGDILERGAGCERKSSPSLLSIDTHHMPKENSEGCSRKVKVLDISTETPNDENPKNASRRSNDKNKGSRRKTKQEAPALKQSSEVDKYSSATRNSVGNLSKDMSLVEMPDHSSTLFHQPFTGLQQVQLRAQIFVYGALISGIPPDEAYMVSAFRDTDGGRILWEGVWRASISRFQNQNSPSGGFETPSHSRPALIPEQISIGNDIQSKVPITSSAKSASAVLNSSVPLPPPQWSVSYGDGHRASTTRGSYLKFCQSTSPLPACQPSVSRQHCSTVTTPETVHLTPIRDSPRPHIPNIQLVSPGILMSAPHLTSATAASVLQMDTTRTAASVSNKPVSISRKTGKSKKGEAAEEPTVSASRTLRESISALNVVKSCSQPFASMLQPSNPLLKVGSGAPVSISVSQMISPTHYQIIDDNSNQQMAIFSEETCSKIDQAKLQAEDAAALAASTVKHSQAIWNQLAAQKNTGLASQIEEKLASAAVSAAVAASVVKAAAAAAKVASDIVLQAKVMSDEAMTASKSGMSSACEDARRWVESASAATKRAENLDAIVKAAELAAEALAQAGTIIAMGDPLPFTLSELVDAGPDRFWKAHHSASMKLSKMSSMHVKEDVGLGSPKGHGRLAKQFDEQFLKDKETQKKANEGRLFSLNECHDGFEGTTQGNFLTAGHEKDHSVSYSSIQKDSIVEVMSFEDGLRGAWFSARVLEMKDNKAYVCYNDVSTNEGQLKEWIVFESERGKAPRIRSAHSMTSVKYEGIRKRRREHLGSYIWSVGDHVDAWIHDRWWEGTVAEKSLGDETKLTVHFPARGDKQVVRAWNLRPSLVWKDGQWMEWCPLGGKLHEPHEGDTPQEKRRRFDRLEATTHSEVDAAGKSKPSQNSHIEESGKPDESRPLNLSSKDMPFIIGKNLNSKKEPISDALKLKRTGLQKAGSRVVFGVPKPGKKRKFMEVSKHYIANMSEKNNAGNDSIKFAKYLMPRASQQFRNTSKVDNKGKQPSESKRKRGVNAENSQGFQTRSHSEKDKALLTSANLVNNNGIDTINAIKFGSLPNQDEQVNVSAVPPAPSAPSLKKKIAPGSETDLAVKAKPTMDKTTKVADKGSGYGQANVPPVLPALTAPSSMKMNTAGSETDLAVKAKPTMYRASKGEDKGTGNPGEATHELMELRRSNRRIQPTSRLLEGIQSSLIIPKMFGISHEKKSHRGGSFMRGNAHV